MASGQLRQSRVDSAGSTGPASQLRAVLPAALVDRLDLTNLHPVPGSFVDQELTHRHCDVLMRTRLDG